MQSKQVNERAFRSAKQKLRAPNSAPKRCHLCRLARLASGELSFVLLSQLSCACTESAELAIRYARTCVDAPQTHKRAVRTNCPSLCLSFSQPLFKLSPASLLLPAPSRRAAQWLLRAGNWRRRRRPANQSRARVESLAGRAQLVVAV